MRILNGIIPDHWTEKVDETQNTISSYVDMKDDVLTHKQWRALVAQIHAEFPNQVGAIYENYVNYGEKNKATHSKSFTIYLKKLGWVPTEAELRAEAQNKETIKQHLIKFERHKGQMVIEGASLKVMRLIGLEDDGEDYFFIFIYQDELHFSGHFTPLKHYIPYSDYQRFTRISRMNDKDVDDEDNIYYRTDPTETESFRMEKEMELEKTLLAPLYWEIN